MLVNWFRLIYIESVCSGLVWVGIYVCSKNDDFCGFVLKIMGIKELIFIENYGN